MNTLEEFQAHRTLPHVIHKYTCLCCVDKHKIQDFRIFRIQGHGSLLWGQGRELGRKVYMEGGRVVLTVSVMFNSLKLFLKNLSDRGEA